MLIPINDRVRDASTSLAATQGRLDAGPPPPSTDDRDAAARDEHECETQEPLAVPVDAPLHELTARSFEVCRDDECIDSRLEGLAGALAMPNITLSFHRQAEDGGDLAVYLELRGMGSSAQRLVFAWEEGGFCELPAAGASSYRVTLFAPDGEIESETRLTLAQPPPDSGSPSQAPRGL